ncbi:ABC transporter ATP-binding protein [Haloarcula salinisoli]|uniref:ABC transporter ATP-binding protein/permease n=1 Tax=Haloarcula salinisoli TaxID=2487746 RepID=A0A8J8C9L0_9EURY|nr:ABC transporter ATP-binding protein [Halomicroarcula salinisoli]MBX0286458.1 ABC transporter ATP-binding protein/permease [Halomicroarcula salinisoli]MBX0302053.1 ABC transporter ATP-binding protein/permease [Halomicroarcula salinisoli]
MVDKANDIPIRTQLRSLLPVATYRPVLTVAVVATSLLAALLEGVGIGFLLPIIEITQSNGDPSGPVRALATAYAVLGVPFELGYIVAGVALVIGVRYLMSFLSGWLTAILRMTYIRSLRTEAFEYSLSARLEYIDQTGSDEILNALITQTTHASEAIHRIVLLVKGLLISAAYLSIALYVAPYLMIGTGLVLGAFMLCVRYLFESGYSVGSRVADANERLQESIQSSIQGIREVRILGSEGQQLSRYRAGVNKYTAAMIDRRRNQEAIRSLNYFVTAVFVFLLLYVGIEFRDISLGGLGVFLFAMFRLGPKLSHMNTLLYELETDLPHLVRTQEFVAELAANQESNEGTKPVSAVDTVTFENVSFQYHDDEPPVLEDISFSFERGDVVAFAGPSGAGKSTIISLVARLYEPTEGRIAADGTSISAFSLDEWRDRVAIVQQDPYIFNDTLHYNVAVGNLYASPETVARACEIAQVTEFVDDLQDGYETVLGDDGVRLSGGQQQRVAIARALVEDADILLFDEATSDLDSALEQRIYQNLTRVEDEYAVVTVTHRLSTVTDVAQINILDDGTIVESGTHEELLDEAGKYAGLLDAQRAPTAR